ncbi:galactose mutarotase-like enzyme [Elusimicrobium posterum]|uniref:DUF5107 domain-containing protein n=1 Tax=Elusimicrobium posterum TaxID=3116653 RepID=UPI003C737D14
MQKSIYKNIPSIILENDFINVQFLPSYGCKMASLVSKKTGREFLFQSKLQQLTVPHYGASFSAYDSSGFDEVFPSIDLCPYPSGNYAGTIIPDHGEVWAMPWTVEQADKTSITASVRSPKLPYVLKRALKLEDNQISIKYTVTNTNKTEPFKFIWALHALLACTPSTKILTPENLKQIMTVEHGTQNLGPWGTLHSYPVTKSVKGKDIDMSAVEPVTANNCEKFYFTSQNSEGWCGVEHTDTGEKLIYQYDADKVPYLGVWKTQGGYRGDYNIALEPCTGIYDDLYVGSKIKKVSEVAPLGEYSWSFKMLLK